MDLWIRTQSKETLLKVEEINLFEFDNFCRLETPTCVLGEYKTKERALEVLGEIHNHLEKLFWFNPKIEEDRRLNQLIKSYVYNMPKE